MQILVKKDKFEFCVIQKQVLKSLVLKEKKQHFSHCCFWQMSQESCFYLYKQISTNKHLFINFYFSCTIKSKRKNIVDIKVYVLETEENQYNLKKILVFN